MLSKHALVRMDVIRREGPLWLCSRRCFPSIIVRHPLSASSRRPLAAVSFSFGSAAATEKDRPLRPVPSPRQ